MANYNRFGASYTDVVSLFTNVVAADLGGQSDMEAMMDQIESEMVAKMNGWIRRCLTRVDGMLVEEASTALQTVIDVPTAGGLAYDCTSEHEVWSNWSYPLQMPEPGTGYSSGDGVTVSDNSGAVRLTLTTGLAANSTLIMNCTLDPTNAAFAVDSLKKTLIMGAAGLLGPRAYTREDASPVGLYVKQYRERLKLLTKPGLHQVPEFADRKQVTQWGKAIFGLTGRLER